MRVAKGDRMNKLSETVNEISEITLTRGSKLPALRFQWTNGKPIWDSRSGTLFIEDDILDQNGVSTISQHFLRCARPIE